VRTGKKLWTFHTVPRDGEPGALAGALAFNPFPWWEKLPMDVSP
jgi:hypothetical protein